jgi:hypothetical protein
MKRLAKFFLFCLLAVGIPPGCGTQGGPVIPLPPPSGPDEPDPPKPKAGLTVDPLPTTTDDETVGVTGTADPGASVFVTGGASPIVTDASVENGRFCLPVKLNPGALNRLEFRAQVPDMGLSETVIVQIEHLAGATNGGGDVTTPTQHSKNVALGLTVTAKDTPIEGNLSLLTDDSASTIAVFEDSDWFGTYDGWIAITLDELTPISKINIRWRDYLGVGDQHFGMGYKVLISNEATPGEPSLTNGHWYEVLDENNGDGGLDIVNLQTQVPLARHVALWMLYDHAKNFGDRFALAEIEIWDEPLGTTPVPQPGANICADGSY